MKEIYNRELYACNECHNGRRCIHSIFSYVTNQCIVDKRLIAKWIPIDRYYKNQRKEKRKKEIGRLSIVENYQEGKLSLV